MQGIVLGDCRKAIDLLSHVGNAGNNINRSVSLKVHFLFLPCRKNSCYFYSVSMGRIGRLHTFIGL